MMNKIKAIRTTWNDSQLMIAIIIIEYGPKTETCCLSMAQLTCVDNQTVPT